MGLCGSWINEENHIVNGSWIAWAIDDSIGAILSVPFCPYHFVPYHFVLEPLARSQSYSSSKSMVYPLECGSMFRIFPTWFVTCRLHVCSSGLQPRQQKFRAMNGANLASPIRGELGYAQWPQPSWASKFIALLGTKFGAH